MKIFGNEKTNLVLSDKAFEVYSSTDPLKIIEEDDGSYTITGVIGRYGLSAEQVNSVLESFAGEDEEDEEEEEEDKMTLVDLYNRTYKNCMFYRERNMDLHLLNEIGVLRGIVYCMEAAMGEPTAHKSIDFNAFKTLIAEQERLRNK